jgi:hypothetical protein
VSEIKKIKEAKEKIVNAMIELENAGRILEELKDGFGEVLVDSAWRSTLAAREYCRNKLDA